jgi:hypothetical protein
MALVAFGVGVAYGWITRIEFDAEGIRFFDWKNRLYANAPWTELRQLRLTSNQWELGAGASFIRVPGWSTQTLIPAILGHPELPVIVEPGPRPSVPILVVTYSRSNSYAHDSRWVVAGILAFLYIVYIASVLIQARLDLASGLTMIGVLLLGLYGARRQLREAIAKSGTLHYTIHAWGLETRLGRNTTSIRWQDLRLVDEVGEAIRLYSSTHQVEFPRKAEDYDLVRQFAIALAPPGAAIRFAPEVK